MTSLRYNTNLTDSAPQQQSVWVFGPNSEDQKKQQQQAANNASNQKANNKIKKNKNKATIAMATKSNANQNFKK
ncbi:MAG: hypothetical protein MHMPM18_004792 [Marteilia pararefringens]